MKKTKDFSAAATSSDICSSFWTKSLIMFAWQGERCLVGPYCHIVLYCRGRLKLETSVSGRTANGFYLVFLSAYLNFLIFHSKHALFACMFWIWTQ